MNENGAGPKPVRVDRETDFAIFDSLPAELRAALSGAVFNYPAGSVAPLIDQFGVARAREAIRASDLASLDAMRRKEALVAKQKGARRRAFAAA